MAKYDELEKDREYFKQIINKQEDEIKQLQFQRRQLAKQKDDSDKELIELLNQNLSQPKTFNQNLNESKTGQKLSWRRFTSFSSRKTQLKRLSETTLNKSRDTDRSKWSTLKAAIKFNRK